MFISEGDDSISFVSLQHGYFHKFSSTSIVKECLIGEDFPLIFEENHGRIKQTFKDHKLNIMTIGRDIVRKKLIEKTIGYPNGNTNVRNNYTQYFVKVLGAMKIRH
jgi:hypothetical protein